MSNRRVSVYLDLDSSAFNKGAAATANVLRGVKAEIREFGDKVDDASQDLDQLAANTVPAAKGIDHLGDESRQTAVEVELLDNRIKAAERSVARLGLAFARGDTSVEKALNDERSLLGQLRRIRREVETGGGGGRRGSFTNWFGFDASGFVSEARGAAIAGLVALAVLLSPMLGAMVEGAVVGAVGGGGIVGGIVAAAHDPRVKQAWQDTIVPLMRKETFGSDAFVGPVIEGLHELRNTVLDINIGDVLAKGAPAVRELVKGLDGFVRNIMPGFNEVMGGADDIMAVFGAGIADTGDALSDFMHDMVESKGTLQGLQAIFMIFNGTIRATGDFLKFLGDTFHWFIGVNERLTGAGATVLGWVPWLGTRIREMHTNMQLLNNTGQITETVVGGVGRVIAQLPPPIESAADALARVNREFDDMHTHLLDLTRSDLDFEEALDNVAASVEKNGTSLDKHTEQGRANIRMLLDGAEAAERERRARIDSGVATSTANSLYADQIELLIRQMVLYGFNEQAVRKFIAALAQVPPVTTAQLLLEMETRGVLPGEHSGPRIGDNPDFVGSGPTAAQIRAEAGATGRLQPEVNVDPYAQFLADRAEGRRAFGGPVLAGHLYQVQEHGPEYFRPNFNGMVMPLTASDARGWGGGASAGDITVTVLLDGQAIEPRMIRVVAEHNRDTRRRVMAGATR